jgi:23S rRNA pseudouridine2605 synthase
MMEAVGHAVSRLIRIRYGAMLLPRGLKRGGWMELDDRDIQALMKAAGSRPAVVSDVPPARSTDTRGGRNNMGRGPRPSRTNAAPGPVVNRGATGQSRRGEQGRKAPVDRTNAQPDPLKTSVGYIGADSLARQRKAPHTGGPRRSGGRNR